MGTEMSDLPADRGEHMLRLVRSAVVAILWHQGETDVPLMAAPVYQTKFDSLIDHLRGRYGADLPFLVGQMVAEEMELSGKDYGVFRFVGVSAVAAHAMDRDIH